MEWAWELQRVLGVGGRLRIVKNYFSKIAIVPYSDLDLCISPRANLHRFHELIILLDCIHPSDKFIEILLNVGKGNAI